MQRISITMIGAFLLGCFGLPTKTYAADYIWCNLSDGSNSKSYYSQVFAGDYSKSIGIQVAFTNYVHANYDKVIGTAGCRFNRDEASAKSDRDSSKGTDRRIYKEVIQTDWTY
jgi:hypothetical protein